MIFHRKYNIFIIYPYKNITKNDIIYIFYHKPIIFWGYNFHFCVFLIFISLKIYYVILCDTYIIQAKQSDKTMIDSDLSVLSDDRQVTYRQPQGLRLLTVR
jgi:hypothetical protein